MQAKLKTLISRAKRVHGSQKKYYSKNPGSFSKEAVPVSLRHYYLTSMKTDWQLIYFEVNEHIAGVE